jgi:methylglutaconyl-CoA hydratase
MSDLVLTESLAPGLTLVTLNRPERRNALSIALLDFLCDKVEQLAADPSNRVIILQGAGPVFSAGLDLKEASDSALVQRSAGCVERALNLMRETPLVTIAAVRGGAFAGGAGLMAACDMAVGATDAMIGFPEARRGLLPALICGVLKTKVREGDLRELFLVGNPIGAHKAEQIGLFQRIVDSDKVLSEATELAMSVLQGGPETIRQTKQLLNHSFRSDDDHSSLIDVHLQARYSKEAQEGLSAFLEKRSPFWTSGIQN